MTPNMRIIVDGKRPGRIRAFEFEQDIGPVVDIDYDDGGKGWMPWLSFLVRAKLEGQQ